MWDIKPISSLCTLAIDCVNKTAPIVDYPTPYKMLRTTNIKKGFIDFETVRYVEKSVYENWTRRSKPQFGDVIFTREAPVGEVGRFTSKEDNFFLGQRLFHYRPNPNLLDWNYLAYVLQGSLIQGWVNGIAFGATVSHIKVEDAENLEIPVPPLPLQKMIGGILSAYDDLIENNYKRIKILEEMAQKLYKEWFVDFKFPGHEKTKFIESELSRIPEGWELATLGSQLIELESGKRPKGGIVSGIMDGVPSIGAENISGIGKHNFASEKLISREFFRKMRKGVVRDRDVAIYKDGAYIGRSSYFRDGFPHAECSVNEHVFLLRTNGVRLTQNALYLWLQEPDTVQTIRATNANAAQPGINQQSLGGVNIILPDKKTAAYFDRIIEPLLAEVINLAKQNQNLVKTRDLLLPRLISGELSVEELKVAA